MKVRAVDAFPVEPSDGVAEVEDMKKQYEDKLKELEDRAKTAKSAPVSPAMINEMVNR